MWLIAQQAEMGGAQVLAVHVVDGQRLAIHRLPVDAAREIRIVQNWFSELERLVPTN